jgi:hypothetical protein
MFINSNGNLKSKNDDENGKLISKDDKNKNNNNNNNNNDKIESNSYSNENYQVPINNETNNKEMITTTTTTTINNDINSISRKSAITEQLNGDELDEQELNKNFNHTNTGELININDANEKFEMNQNEIKNQLLKSNSCLGVLNWQQMTKLDQLLHKDVAIHGRGNFPTLNVQLKDFIRKLENRLVQQHIKVRGVRINGGVASYVLAEEDDYLFSDIDIIFACDLLELEVDQSNDDNEMNIVNSNTIQQSINNFKHNPDVAFSLCCDIIKETVFSCLFDYFPESSNKEKLKSQHLKEAYVKKMVKIYQSSTSVPSVKADMSLKKDAESRESMQSSSRWSLISLCNDKGQNIELKFVDKMKRQFQFSVDAFQIHLDSLLKYYDQSDKEAANNNKSKKKFIN